MNSIFENIYGANYSNNEQLKLQFHLFLHILSYKLTNDSNNYSIVSQISLIESLICKIKKRNIPIFLEIMNVFEDIKSETLKNDDVFLLDSEKYIILDILIRKKKLNINLKFLKFWFIKS